MEVAAAHQHSREKERGVIVPSHTGQYAFGSRLGRHVVLLLTTLELLGSSTMCLIILEQQVELFLPYDGTIQING